METSYKIGNWGRWGAKDERGAVNFVTPEVLKESLASVKQGKVYSLAIPLQLRDVPLATRFDGRAGCVHLMSLDGGDFAAGTKRAGTNAVETADDFIFLSTHGTTHIDALCHCWAEGQLYNGFSGNTGLFFQLQTQIVNLGASCKAYKITACDRSADKDEDYKGYRDAPLNTLKQC